MAAFVDKAEGRGHNEKASLELQPRFSGVSPTAFVPEWRNWQTRRSQKPVT